MMKSTGLHIGRIVLIFCLIFSVWIVLNIPTGYSLSYCIQCATIYIIAMMVTLINCIRTQGYYGLCTIIFIIVFFATNYLYPLYFYINDSLMLIFSYEFAEHNIDKGTAIATLGGVAFMVGCYNVRYKKCNHLCLLLNDPKIKYFQRIQAYEKIIIVVCAMLILYNTWGTILSRTYSTTAQFEDKTASSYLKIVYVYLYYLVFKDFCRISPIASSLRSFWRLCCKPIHLVVALLVFINLYVGGRTLALNFFLLYPLCYSIFIKRIQIRYLFVGAMAILMLLFIVGRVRGEYGVSATDAITNSSFIYYFQDLAINSRSLYELIHYADSYGATLGRTMLLDIFSYIPFGQSLLMAITGFKPIDISSPHLVTYMYFGNNPEIGLGTNMIGDIYVSFKTIGVFFLMYVLGRGISKISQKAMTNIIYMLMFSMLSTQMVFVVRNGYFSIWRYVIWGIGLYLFDKYTYKRQIK